MLLGTLWSWGRHEVVLVKWRDGVVECCSGEAVSSGEGMWSIVGFDWEE